MDKTYYKCEAIKKILPNSFLIVINSEKTRKNLYLVSVVVAMLLVLLPAVNTINSPKYVMGSDDSVVGIERAGKTSSEVYEFNLIIENKDGKSQKNIIIHPVSQKEAAEEKKTSSKAEKEQIRDIEINNIVTSIEASDDNHIDLPNQLKDGSTLKWYRISNTHSSTLMILLLYVLLVVLIIKSSIDELNKPSAWKKDSIVRDLPRFVNQIVMMMDAGLILSDILTKVRNSYIVIPDSDRSVFVSDLIDVLDDDNRYKTSIVYSLHEYARKESCKELLRITTILQDSELRGSDSRETLKRESDYLWESRKIVANENGKVIDTKMALPLGVLLIILIMVTMAPALLTM